MPRSLNFKSRTESKLLDFVDAFLSAHDVWVEDQNRPNPDEPYCDALEELVNAFAGDADLPGECRELAVAVESLDAEYEAFLNRDDQKNGYPRESFWRAVEMLRSARHGAEEQPLAPLPSIAQLRQQNVPDWQIAKLLGMVPVHDLMWPERYAHLVQKEIDEPGSVMSPAKGWCDPRLRDRVERERQVEAKHEALLAKKHAQNHEDEAWQCPFTVEELIQQQVSDEQIARMHRVDVEYVASVRAEIERAEEEKKRAKEPGAAGSKRSRTPGKAEASPTELTPA